MDDHSIKYTFKEGLFKGFGIAAGHLQASARNTLEQGLVLPGYIIFNGGIRYSYKKFNVALSLNNITNKNYWIGAYNNVNKWPGMPRNFMMTAGYSFINEKYQPRKLLMNEVFIP